MTPEALAIETMFKIVDKDGVDHPFELNGPQRILDDNITGRDIIPKARQLGCSSYFLARYTAACLIRRNVRAVIISHETESTQRLLSRCQYFVRNMRGPNPDVGRSGLNVLTFPKTNSEIYIGTAGSRAFGRGDTITHLLCSEYAYWPNQIRLLSGLLDAVPQRGEVAIESTGNGTGNDYHRRAVRAFEGRTTWRCHFLKWTNDPQYTVELTPEQEQTVLASLDERFEEPQLVAMGLTAGQLVWRRGKLEEKDFDLRLFKQEYPLTFDECFQASGHSLFWKVNFEPTDDWKQLDAGLWGLASHPKVGMLYALGADPAGGVGGDNSCVEIFCIDTQEQVAEYVNDRIEPDVFGDRVVDLAKLYNNAFVTVESNNHGPVTLYKVREREYPPSLVYEMQSTTAMGYEDRTLMQMGFRTTSRTKPLVIGKLRTALANDWKIHSTQLSDELSTFVEDSSGKLGAEPGCHDDRVIAAACALLGVDYAWLAKPAAPTAARSADPFLLDTIINDLSKRGRSYPVRAQHASAWSGIAAGQILTLSGKSEN